jgi:hypothetical protein
LLTEGRRKGKEREFLGVPRFESLPLAEGLTPKRRDEFLTVKKERSVHIQYDMVRGIAICLDAPAVENKRRAVEPMDIVKISTVKEIGPIVQVIIRFISIASTCRIVRIRC